MCTTTSHEWRVRICESGSRVALKGGRNSARARSVEDLRRSQVGGMKSIGFITHQNHSPSAEERSDQPKRGGGGS